MENEDKRIAGLDDPDSIEAMRRRHLSIGLRMQAVAVAALQELEAKVAAGERLDMSAEDAKTLLNSGSRLEREALGESGDAPTTKAKKPN